MKKHKNINRTGSEVFPLPVLFIVTIALLTCAILAFFGGLLY